MVRDEVLRALGDPGEVAYAQLLGLCEGRRKCQTSGVGERRCASGERSGDVRIDSGAPQLLGGIEVEAEELALVGHIFILTAVDMCGGRSAVNCNRGRHRDWLAAAHNFSAH